MSSIVKTSERSMAINSDYHESFSPPTKLTFFRHFLWHRQGFFTIEVAFSQPYEPRTGFLSLRIFPPFFLPPKQVHLLKFVRAYRFAISQTKLFSVFFCPPFAYFLSVNLAQRLALQSLF